MKDKMKWVIISMLIIVLAVVAVIVIVNKAKLNYKVEKISEYNYFVLSQGEKYGVIDKNGNVLIQPNYVAVQIPNPSKPIFICISEYITETKEYVTTVYNEKNEQILSDYQSVQAIPIQTNIDENPYEKSTLTYKKDGKYGLVTLQGKKITEAIYDEVSSMNYKEGTFVVKQGDLTGVINMKGTQIIKNEYENIISDNYYNEATQNKTTGFIVSKKTENGYRYGYINHRGKVILDPEYTEIERITDIPNEKELYFIAFKDGQAGLLKNKKVILNYEYEEIQYNSLNDIFIVQRNGKQGAVKKDGSIILNAEYNNILFGGLYLNAIKDGKTYIFDLQGNKIETDKISLTKTDNENYLIAIDKNDIYTIVDASGNTIIDSNYSYIEYLPGDYFIVSRDGKNGVIDITGKSVIDLKYTSIFRLNATNLLQAEISQTKTIELYNMQMQKVASMEGATLREYEKSQNNSLKYLMLASENDFRYYDENGNELDAKTIFTQNNLFAKQLNEKWGFVDKESNLKVQNEYEMVTNFNEYGFAGIKKDGKWGVIDSNGNIIQEPLYELDWIQPNFIGKYYRINAWYGDTRYSGD